MMRSVLVVACIASATAFGLAPATPALRAAGKASLPLASRPAARVGKLGGATKLAALGNLFGNDIEGSNRRGSCAALPTFAIPPSSSLNL